jgi:hypothetical protein
VISVIDRTAGYWASMAVFEQDDKGLSFIRGEGCVE